MKRTEKGIDNSLERRQKEGLDVLFEDHNTTSKIGLTKMRTYEAYVGWWALPNVELYILLFFSMS